MLRDWSELNGVGEKWLIELKKKRITSSWVIQQNWRPVKGFCLGVPPLRLFLGTMRLWAPSRMQSTASSMLHVQRVNRSNIRIRELCKHIFNTNIQLTIQVYQHNICKVIMLLPSQNNCHACPQPTQLKTLTWLSNPPYAIHHLCIPTHFITSKYDASLVS